MRKVIIVALLLIISAASFSQQTNPSPDLTKQDYLKKSKNQNTIAWILLGGGFAFTSTGLILGANSAAEELVGAFTGESSNTFETGTAFFFIGLATMAGSIPFFIASTRNKKKAAAVSASFKIETSPFVSQAVLIKTGYPAIAVKINF